MHIRADLAVTPRVHARAWLVVIICIYRRDPMPGTPQLRRMPVLSPSTTAIEFAPALTAGYWAMTAAVVVAEVIAIWVSIRGIVRARRISRSLPINSNQRPPPPLFVTAVVVYGIVAAAGVGGLLFVGNELLFRVREIRVDEDRVVMDNFFERVVASIPKRTVTRVDFTRDNRRNGYCTIGTARGTTYCTVRFADDSKVVRLKSALPTTP